MTNTSLTLEQWTKCAAVLVAGTGKPMTAQQAEVYFDLLQDLEYETLKNACRRALQESESNWLPSVGLIRKFAAEASYGALPLPGEAWDQVKRAISAYGWPRPSEGMASLSPLLQKAVRAIGGWQVICDSEQPSVLAGQFRMAYESLAKRETEMRRVSADLRPAITSGPVVTPRLQDQRRNEIHGLVEGFAKKLRSADEPAA